VEHCLASCGSDAAGDGTHADVKFGDGDSLYLVASRDSVKDDYDVYNVKLLGASYKWPLC
jgi:hypothetical protein